MVANTWRTRLTARCCRRLDVSDHCESGSAIPSRRLSVTSYFLAFFLLCSCFLILPPHFFLPLRFDDMARRMTCRAIRAERLAPGVRRCALQRCRRRPITRRKRPSSRRRIGPHQRMDRTPPGHRTAYVGSHRGASSFASRPQNVCVFFCCCCVFSRWRVIQSGHPSTTWMGREGIR